MVLVCNTMIDEEIWLVLFRILLGIWCLLMPVNEEWKFSLSENIRDQITRWEQTKQRQSWYYFHVIYMYIADKYFTYSHDPGDRAGPLSEINFSCVHMVVFIPPIDWYVYLKVWKINYAIPSTRAHFNIFHPGRRDGVFIWENSNPLAEISLSGPAQLPIWTQQNFW